MAFSIGIFYAVLSMIGFGMSDALSKMPSKRIGAKRTILYRNIFTTLLLAIAFFIFARKYSFSVPYILVAFLIGLLGYIPLLSFYKALKLGKIGVIAPIANSSVIFTVLFAVLFYRETITLWQLLSMAVVFSGMIVVLINFKDIKASNIFSLSSGVPFALLTCFLWGLVFFLIKIPINAIGPFLTALIIEFSITIVSFFHIYFFSNSSLRLGKKKGIILYMILLAFFGAFGALFSNLAIESYNVSIASAIIFANPVVTAIYGKIAYKERLLQKEVAAIVLMIIGIVSLAYLS